MEKKIEQKILFAYIAGAMFGVQNCRKGVKTAAIYLSQHHFKGTTQPRNSVMDIRL